MKQLQDSKLVFVCVQNDKTKSNDAAMQGVRDFKADARFASATEIVMLDPTDSAEASFLADMKIDPKTEEAMTVFLAPPGSAIAEYKGATDKAELVATLQKASSGLCGRLVRPRRMSAEVVAKAAPPRSVHIHGRVFPNPFLSEDSRNEATSLGDYRRCSCGECNGSHGSRPRCPHTVCDGPSCLLPTSAKPRLPWIGRRRLRSTSFSSSGRRRTPQTDKAWSVLQPAAAKLADSAEVVSIQITDPAEKQIVDKYGVTRAPMPLVLAVAPCGAITKAFTEDIR